MKFKEFNIIRVLKNRYPKIQIGDIGSIVMTFDEPCEAYEVEFINENGETKELYVFLPDEIEIVNN